MEKQGQTKSVDQNITEPKTLPVSSDAAAIVEETDLTEFQFNMGFGREMDVESFPDQMCRWPRLSVLSSCKEYPLTEYLLRGSLENQLFKRHSTPLPWTTRLKIAFEVAEGLALLHGAKKPVIYRDLKVSTILLDSAYNAKLSNLLGWAKDGPEGDDTHVSTGVMVMGIHTAPEYIMTGPPLITRNMFSELDNNELRRSYGNVPRDPEFPYDYTYEHRQHIRKDIIEWLSSLVVSIVVVIGIFYNIWSIQLSIFQVQPLHKEHNYRLSIWPSLLGLFGFMVFVCAVAVMNLVRAQLTSMQKAMLIFLAILMHLQSANSIIDVFVALVGALFMGWHAFAKIATTK